MAIFVEIAGIMVSVYQIINLLGLAISVSGVG
jgi:hypothetical protein